MRVVLDAATLACPPTAPSAAPASAACTASTWATSWPRCSTCSAPFRGACGDCSDRGDAHRAAWAVLDSVPDPEVPALSVRDLGIVRDVLRPRRGAGDRAHAHLLRLPGHRGHRAQRDRRPRRRRPRPGARDDAARAGLDAPTGSARTAGASCATTASRRPGPLAEGDGVPMRIFGRRADAVACPRCGSAAPSACRPSAPPPARRCTAAWPAASPSSTSSRYERGPVPRPARAPHRARHGRGRRSSPSTCRRSCARSSASRRAST